MQTAKLDLITLTLLLYIRLAAFSLGLYIQLVSLTLALNQRRIIFMSLTATIECKTDK